MIKGNVFNMICELTSKKFSSQNHSAMELLYGFAKLVSMNEGVLSFIFENDDDRQEIKRILQLFDAHNIQPSLLCDGASFLADNNEAILTSSALQIKLDEIQNSSSSYTAYDIAKFILEMKIPQLELCKKGKTLDDIFSYYDKNKSKASNTKKKDNLAIEQGEKEKVDTADSAPAKKAISKDQKFKKLSDDTNKLYERLSSLVMGQNEAIRTFAQGYFQSEVLKDQEEDKKGVSSSFLFAGPPGVGKTFLSTTAADILGIPFKRLDMTEYSMPSSVYTLTGVPKAHGGDKPGELTGFVSSNPKCIVLIDEVEKADNDVLQLFLQVLDAGTLTDSFTKKSVHFRDAILIFTTNAGKSLYEDYTSTNLSSIPRSVVINAIRNDKDDYNRPFIPAPLCSRFSAGNMVMFNFLDVHNLAKIANSKFDSYAGKIQDMYGYSIEIDKKLAPMLLFAQSSNMDARNISSQSVILLKNEMFELGRHIPQDSTALSGVKKISFVVDAQDDEKFASFFENQDQTNIVFFGDEADICDVPFSDKCNVILAKDIDDIISIVEKKDIAFVIIDPLYAPIGDKKDYLSLDDMRTQGILAFDRVTDKLPQIPVYLLEKSHIAFEDQSMFNERGARGFISLNDKIEFSNIIANISDMMYMQKKVDELSSRGRVLKYNTAQRIVDNGERAEIIFYDFKTAIAADASENRLILSDANRPKETFDDVIGAENAKEELKYFVDFLRNPKSFVADGQKTSKGILLYGPPGTGKTMLARAMAGESDASFFSVTGAGFQDKYVNEGEKKIQKLFKTAKKFAPSIIFIDEIDAIGKERTGSEHTHYTESLLNTLLTEMEGFEFDPSKPIFILAATNFGIDGNDEKNVKLDPALLRRFSNKIYVDLPNVDEREIFIRRQLDKISNNVVSESAIINLSQRTTGQSCATLYGIIELGVRTASKAKTVLNDNYLLNAFEEYLYGEKKSFNQEYFVETAYHEAGHAYVCNCSGEKPSFVTIVSRGRFGGYMQPANSENTPSYTKDDLIWIIRTALAGRASEIVFFGEDKAINTGASSDLEHATDIAIKMICRYGMIDGVSYSLSSNLLFQTPLVSEIMAKVNEIIDTEMKNTIDIVRQGKEKIDSLAKFLIANNQATQDDIQEAFK